MVNIVPSPNMNLPVPVVGQDPGVDWANNINACLSGIDSHNHSSGQGVPITPSGISINADLPFNGNNATTVKTVRFSSQAAALAAAVDVGCLYEVGVDLYFNDGAGNQVRITQSGSVTGSAGTITGLPSGTASASFAGSTFTFQSATSTPAQMAVGPLVIGRSAASSKTVTLAPNAAQAANYALTFPAALPAGGAYMTVDNTGALSYNASSSTGSGAVVLQTAPTIAAPVITGNSSGTGIVPLGAVIGTFPNLTGAYSCTATTAADSNGYVKCNGQTISDGTSPMNGQVVPNINSTVFLAGSTTSGSTGGAASVTLSSANLAGHTHTFTSSTSVASSTHTHNFHHAHQWGKGASNGYDLLALKTLDSSSTGISPTPDGTTAYVYNFQGVKAGSLSGAGDPIVTLNDWYTTGAIDAPNGSGSSAVTAGASASTTVSGTTASTGSGTSFSILPTYITALYVMRIK